MAVFFTLGVEYYREADAVRLGELLRPLVLPVAAHRIPMAVVDVFEKFGLWYVFAHPKGPGFCEFGCGEGMNKPEVTDEIIEQLYAVVGKEDGVRRACCGYEAHEHLFDDYGGPNHAVFEIPDLVYDRAAADRLDGAEDYGLHYYRNPPRVIDWSGFKSPDISAWDDWMASWKPIDIR